VSRCRGRLLPEPAEDLHRRGGEPRRPVRGGWSTGAGRVDDRSHPAQTRGYSGGDRGETRRAIFDGAREIDTVINVGALKSGDLRLTERDIEAVVSACRDCGVLSKVIIEAALLTEEEKVAACTLAKAAGAGYVKTSTGFGPGGATTADVALMRRVVGSEMGVKAAGGVRDYEAVKAMVAAGATRIGASAGVKIVQQARGEHAVATPSRY
jgi:deoxyribose-phosphate aldolase